MAKRKDAEKFLDRLNGQKTLILGNHDKNIKNSTRFAQITQIKDFNYSRQSINIHIVLCHYPMHSWDRKVHGSWHLYGHVHGRLDIPGLAMDVGIDHPQMNYKPINLYEVCQIMDKKQQNYEKELDRIQYLEEENRKLKFMINNGLGWDDMRDDITYPAEI